MRSRILRRYLWTAFLLFASTLVAFDFYAVHVAWIQRTDRLRARLESAAAMVATQPVTQASAWVRSAASASGYRVQVLNASGANIAESGAADRDSISAEVPLRNPQDGSIVRVSAPLAEARAQVADLRRRLAELTLVCAAIGFLLMYVFMRSFTRRIERLRTYIEGLPDATLPDEELPGGNDGLGSLSQALRRTAPKIRDLVDRLKLEGARREAILASMVEGVLAVDQELHVTFCNASFARTVGARMPVPEGTPLLEVARDPALRDIFVTVLQTHKPLERRVQLRGSQAHSFEVQAVPLGGAEAPGALAILHDITELERLERVRKDFVANVSHELRTPLASIRGYAETLLDGALEDQEHNRNFVEVILSHSIRLNNIASDLLILSELESSGGQAQPKRLSVRSTIESAIRTVESAARVQGVRLVAGRLDPYYVRGFEIRLEQAFVNLLDNAVKFNRPDGEVRIETNGDKGKVAIVVTDTGIGIPSDDLPRIFERFYRVDKARSRAVGGTGLGLSIVKHVVEQMGGSIRVESELGKGSKFTVLLPCEEVPASQIVIVS